MLKGAIKRRHADRLIKHPLTKRLYSQTDTSPRFHMTISRHFFAPPFTIDVAAAETALDDENSIPFCQSSVALENNVIA